MAPRAFQRFIESPNRSKYLFLRNSGRKTGRHFSWNCSSWNTPHPSCRFATIHLLPQGEKGV
ncbi:MAG: hypothetical protein EOQ32_09945 [Mesorhizobium sp.]|nr:hypothetical protein EJ067_13410 [Mesorhizobium sp. M1D.F.Ca.ET.043.01.1.1]RWA94802.1 MAG: hypothetical protein EOQ32_09945 [Mesorhizobium sp.]RWD99803.1 MAG: hypothetical protein EOS61_30040 [Mesorhizobium sp.]